MSASKEESTKTQKGEQTKALILNAALAVFHERGYEETTMRAIAQRAGVSLGNAYYYFGSKEQLIQAFYHRTHEQHLAALMARPKETNLKTRLLTVMRLLRKRALRLIDELREAAADVDEGKKGSGLALRNRSN